jgi:hypothetical protein
MLGETHGIKFKENMPDEGCSNSSAQTDRSKGADSRFFISNLPNNSILPHRKHRPDHAV